MNLISLGITLEVFLLVLVIVWLRKQNIKQNRQPSLSKKIINDLKI